MVRRGTYMSNNQQNKNSNNSRQIEVLHVSVAVVQRSYLGVLMRYSAVALCSKNFDFVLTHPHLPKVKR
jgi:hypothetical protein